MPKPPAKGIGPVHGKMRYYSDEEIITALRKKRGLVYLAAKALGCAPSTIRSRAETSPDIAEAIANAREEVIDSAEHALFDAVDRGERWALTYLLNKLGASRGYVEVKETIATGQQEVSHSHIHLDVDQLNLPLEARKAILDRIRKQREEASRAVPPLLALPNPNPTPTPPPTPPLPPNQ